MPLSNLYKEHTNICTLYIKASSTTLVIAAPHDPLNDRPHANAPISKLAFEHQVTHTSLALNTNFPTPKGSCSCPRNRATGRQAGKERERETESSPLQLKPPLHGNSDIIIRCHDNNHTLHSHTDRPNYTPATLFMATTHNLHIDHPTRTPPALPHKKSSNKLKLASPDQ